MTESTIKLVGNFGGSLSCLSVTRTSEYKRSEFRQNESYSIIELPINREAEHLPD